MFFEVTCHKAQLLVSIHETSHIMQTHIIVLLLIKYLLISLENNVFSIFWATLLDTSQGNFLLFRVSFIRHESPLSYFVVRLALEHHGCNFFSASPSKSPTTP